MILPPNYPNIIKWDSCYEKGFIHFSWSCYICKCLEKYCNNGHFPYHGQESQITKTVSFKYVNITCTRPASLELIILSVNVCCRTYIVKVPENRKNLTVKSYSFTLRCEGGDGVGVDFDNYSLQTIYINPI